MLRSSLIVLLSVAGLSAGGSESRLIDLVKTGSRDAVRALLTQSADVNAREADGTTALHWAARADDLETAQLLLRAGARADVINRNHITPLSLAAINGSAAMIEALLKAGADPNASLSQGQTALMTAARTGKPDAVKVLLAYGADIHAREQLFGETALIWAAAENHPDVIKVLVEHGADVNVRSNLMKYPRKEFGDGKSGRLTVLPKGGWTPLMYAARQNAMRAVGALAEAGADLNLTDPDGTTALLVATINAHYDLAALLLQKGANPNIGDVTGMTPLYAAVDLSTFPDTPGRPTPKPSGKLDTPDLVSALLAHEADPNARLKRPILVRVHDRGDGTLGEGATPLMRAGKKADIEIMRLLLDKGADPKLATRTQTTALMFTAGLGGRGRFTAFEEKQATEADFIEAARLCLERGADVNAVNDAGQTPLHLAVVARDDSFIRFLAERGARLDIKDKQGRTPLDVALGTGGRGRGAAPAPVSESTVALLRQLIAGGATTTAASGVPR
jgi:ankyrin repeat protein